MAEPKLDIERRVEELEQHQRDIINAIQTMAAWLVQAQTGFGVKDAEGIEKILHGKE